MTTEKAKRMALVNLKSHPNTLNIKKMIMEENFYYH